MKEIGSITDELVRLSRAGFPLIEIDDEFNFVWNPTSRIARSSKFKLRGSGGKEAFVYDPHNDTITISASVVGIPSSVSVTDLTVTNLIPYNGNLLTVDATGLFIDGGIAISDLYTATELDAGQLDNRYYTETELDAGQLDNRYYTETEVDTLLIGYLPLTGGTLTGALSITDTTPATDSTTGALQVDGGISVDEASWFGGDVQINGYGLGFDITESVTEVAHTKVVGNLVYFNGTTYELAQSNNVATVATGIVSKVVDADTFYVTHIGKVTGLTGLSTGEWYYCSDTTAGLLSTTQGATIVNPIGRALSATELMVFPMRADLVQPSVDGLTTRSEYDSVNSQYFYTGRAVQGSAESDAVWKISRFDFSDGSLTFEDGDQLYNNEWDLREAGSYS